jgi:hypothetical protein
MGLIIVKAFSLPSCFSGSTEPLRLQTPVLSCLSQFGLKYQQSTLTVHRRFAEMKRNPRKIRKCDLTVGILNSKLKQK